MGALLWFFEPKEIECKLSAVVVANQEEMRPVIAVMIRLKFSVGGIVAKGKTLIDGAIPLCLPCPDISVFW